MLNPIQDVNELTKLQWDLDSPKLKKAAKNLAIDRWELVRRNIKFFEQHNPDSSQEVISVMYNHHLRKLKTLLNQVLQERILISDQVT